MKLWHDDIRPAPDGWTWARTNEAAIALLETGDVIECSLDHDLGLDHIEMPETYSKLQEVAPEQAHQIFLAGRSEKTGLDLVRWMVENDQVPAQVSIHSWNPFGAQAMAALFAEHGHRCVIAPFDPRDVVGWTA